MATPYDWLPPYNYPCWTARMYTTNSLQVHSQSSVYSVYTWYRLHTCFCPVDISTAFVCLSLSAVNVSLTLV